MTTAPPVVLADWLLTQIAEDEAGPWEHYRVQSEYDSCPAARDPQWSGDLDVGEEFCDCGMPQRRARMLAECEAKRRIVRYAQAVLVSTWDDGNPEQIATDTLRLLALPYADRDGFRDEWRP